MNLPVFLLAFKKDIEIIEKELLNISKTDSLLLRETTEYLVNSGGKRIRPTLVLLCAKFGNYDIEKVKYPAAALELIHAASLAHDDVIDNTFVRRGKPTIGAVFSNHIATYTGDYIFAYMMQLLSKIKNPDAHRLVAKTIVEICKGEIAQIADKYNYDQTLRTYLHRIKRKTALLLATSGQLGAMTADVSEKMQKQLFMFGYYVGMSFQIIDDILDFTSTEKVLGKPVGSDLWQGNITLPTLFALENPKLREKTITIQEGMPYEKVVPIINEIKNSSAIERAHKLGQRYLSKAILAIKDIPNSRHKKNLLLIAKNLGKRKN